VSTVNEHTCIRRVAERVKTDKTVSLFEKSVDFYIAAQSPAFSWYLAVLAKDFVQFSHTTTSCVYVCVRVVCVCVCATQSLDQLQVSLPVLACSVLHITVAKSEK